MNYKQRCIYYLRDHMGECRLARDWECWDGLICDSDRVCRHPYPFADKRRNCEYYKKEER